MLTFVPTPIGNLEDITLRALEALHKSEIVLCEDTRVAKRLFELLSARGFFAFQKNLKYFSNYHTDSIPSSLDSVRLDNKEAQSSQQLHMKKKQFFSFHSHNEDDFLTSIHPSMFQAEVIYLSDAGMPCISDPGAKLVAYAVKHHIAFDILPGACALNVAFCGSGIESTPFMFAGFLPHKKLERQSQLVRLSRLQVGGAYSVICYESPHRILHTLEDIALLLPHVFIVVQKELTKIHQQRFYGRAEEVIAEIETHTIRGEWVIILDFSDIVMGNDYTLHYGEALSLDIPPKIKAKVLSKMNGKSVKECYKELLNEK